MPIGDSNSLNELRILWNIIFRKLRKITYEYVLLKDINDSIKDADNLYKFTKHIPSKVNLIEYNPVDGLGFKKSTEKSTELFMNYLDSRRVNVGLEEVEVKILMLHVDN